MNQVPLNLARALRSRTFDEIIGQELAVRLVKNSLFKKQFFPVYLLAGQRGCGKTTLARVFATAINCSALEEFRQNPRDVSLPCLICESCVAMRAGSHPDFFEIDAASHTGVDNVRSLIESASFLPGLGHKKIYLIDEAHMLSKAAFNALLKIMEEPPATVVFMLATTDPHKILDTVISRCFQLFLSPVEPDVLLAYLASICKKEGIEYQEEALLSIVYESEGSVRDAINCLERVRMAHDVVTAANVHALLGDIGHEQLIALSEKVFLGSPVELLAALGEIGLKRFSAPQIWKKMIDVWRALVWRIHGQPLGPLERFAGQFDSLVAKVSVFKVLQAMDVWYTSEPLFLKTQAPHQMIEMLLMKINSAPDLGPAGAVTPRQPRQSSVGQAGNIVAQAPQAVSRVAPVAAPKPPEPVAILQEQSPWATFLSALAQKNDPLVSSVFKQGRLVKAEQGVVELIFAAHLSFYKELIEQTRGHWAPLIEEVFGPEFTLSVDFSGVDVTRTERVAPVRQAAVAPKAPQANTSYQAAPVQAAKVEQRAASPSQSYGRTGGRDFVKYTNLKPIPDIKDAQKWAKTHAVLKVFPGTVHQDEEINT